MTPGTSSWRAEGGRLYSHSGGVDGDVCHVGASRGRTSGTGRPDPRSRGGPESSKEVRSRRRQKSEGSVMGKSKTQLKDVQCHSRNECTIRDKFYQECIKNKTAPMTRVMKLCTSVN